MKKNLAAKLGVMALVLTLVTSSLVSGTYSKYVSTSSGTSSAKVAKFDFDLNAGGTNIGIATDNTTIHLFDYATDSGVLGNGQEADGTRLIAPGTNGSFVVAINNKSEVKVSTAVVLTETNSGVPIVYTYGSNKYTSNSTLLTNSPTTYSNIAALSTALTTGIGNLNPNTASTNLTVTWAWAFDDASGTKDAIDNATNAADTLLGRTPPTVSLKIAATLTQMDT